MDDAGATFALAASHVSTHSASYAGGVRALRAPAVSAHNLLYLAGCIVDVAVGEGALWLRGSTHTARQRLTSIT